MPEMLERSEIFRAERIIRQTIDDLQLDLTGLTILTEVGSGYFSLTPLIAQMANAEKVFAWTGDSSFGTAESNVEALRNTLTIIGLDGDIDFAINERPARHVELADIITNSGFVRPLDNGLLSNVVKPNVAIPLMFEKWEFRQRDIDLEACRAADISVAGTWESHPNLRVFEYCGELAAKMCFEAGAEIRENHIVVWSNDPFGPVIENTFKRLGAASVRRTTTIDDLYTGNHPTDVLFLCDFHESRPLIGKDGMISIDRLTDASPGIKIVHLIGDVDPTTTDASVQVYPEKRGSPGTMTFTLASLGMTPLIRLQAGGLKVGECLVRGISSTLCQPIV